MHRLLPGERVKVYSCWRCSLCHYGRSSKALSKVYFSASPRGLPAGGMQHRATALYVFFREYVRVNAAALRPIGLRGACSMRCSWRSASSSAYFFACTLLHQFDLFTGTLIPCLTQSSQPKRCIALPLCRGGSACVCPGALRPGPVGAAFMSLRCDDLSTAAPAVPDSFSDIFAGCSGMSPRRCGFA